MSGKLAVVGLGPGDARYLTREALDALDEADALYGYGPYLDRVASRSSERSTPWTRIRGVKFPVLHSFHAYSILDLC